MEPLGTPAKKTSPAPRRRKKVRIPGLWRHKKTGRWYYSPMRFGQRLNINLETKDPDEARTRALELYNNLSEIGLPDELEAEIKAFLSQRASTKKHSRATEKQRPYVLQKFAAWAKARQLKLEHFRPQHAEEYYRYLQQQTNPRTGEKLSETTVQSYIRSGVMPLFEWLHTKRRVVFSNPFRSISLDKLNSEARARSRFCSEKLRDDILRECQRIPKTVISPKRAQWIAFVLHAGFEAGLRKNEIIEARPRWFDLNQGTLTVAEDGDFVPKNRRRRDIPLTTTFKKFLKSYPIKGAYCIAPEGKEKRKRKPGARVKKPRPAILQTERKIREYRYDFEKPYKIVMTHIGKKLKQDLSWVTPHVLRHTFASLLASGNASLFKISKWLGDTARTTERHYAHLQGADRDIEMLRTRAPSKPRKRARK